MPAKSEHVNTDGLLRLFGAQLLKARKQRGWTIRDMSAKAGVTLNMISRAERGVGEISLTSALKLAQALGIRLDELAAAAPHCRACLGVPPPGFTCNECARGGVQ